jgi:TP901 family phage tail tape measure protein
MADIGIRVVVNGVAEARRNIGAVQSDISNLERTIGKLSGTSSTLGQSLTSIGSALVGVGRTLTIAVTAPIAAAGTAAITAGINFEDAFSGIGKTVAGVMTNTGQLTTVGEQVRNEFRQMALEVPIATDKLVELGAVVGQLGVSSDQITKVTEIIAKLGAVSDISTEEAASKLIKLSNILGVTSKDLVRFLQQAGSALVGLGNQSVSTEGEILDLTTRLAAAGEKAKFTAPELLAWATTLADLGVKAESGGSAVSRALTEMVLAVQTGSSNLKTFAKVSGETTDQFVEDFRTNASAALQHFIKSLEDGLANPNSPLKITKDMLSDMGLSGLRAIDVLGRLGEASDLFAKNLAVANREWDRAQALEEAFQKRSTTVASMIQILKNQFTDLGITIFDLVKDGITNLIKGIGDVVDWFKKLSPATQKSILTFLALAAALGPILIVVGGIISAIGTVVTGLEALASVAIPVGIAVAIAAIGAAILGIKIPDFSDMETAFKSLGGMLDNLKGKAEDTLKALGFIKITTPQAPQGMTPRENFDQNGAQPESTIQVPKFDDFIKGLKQLGGEDLAKALENIKKIGDTIGSIFDKLSKSPAVQKALKEIGDAIGHIGSLTLTALLDDLGKFATWLDTHQDQIVAIGEDAAKVAGAFFQIADALAAIAIPVNSGVLDTLRTGVTTIFDLLTGKNATGDIKQGLGNIGTDLQNGAVALQNAGIGLANALSGGNETSQTVSATWQGNFDQLGIIIDQARLNIETKATEIATSISSTLNGAASNIAAGAGNAFTAAATWAQGLVDGVASLAGAFISTAANAASGAVASVLSFVGQAVNAGITLINGVIAGLASGIGNLASTASTAASNAANSFLGAAGAFAAAGVNFIQGAIGGIESMIGALAGAAADAANQAAGAFSGALGIQSPSKVTMKFGEFFMEGVAVGINNALTSTIDTISSATGSMVSALSAVNGVSAPSTHIVNNTRSSQFSFGDITGVPITSQDSLVDLLSDRILAVGV